jgi:hypothetical protein
MADVNSMKAMKVFFFTYTGTYFHISNSSPQTSTNEPFSLTIYLLPIQ